MSEELVVYGQKPKSSSEIVAQVNQIQHVMERVMKKDIHFGVIPGCKKPSLYKPGAEKILMTFNIAAADPIIEDLSENDEIRYRVTQRGLRQSDGALLGSASGECSSDEEKYKWRKPVCDAEFNETAEDRKRVVWKNGMPPFQVKQVRTHHKDIANTILKMAVKRALVAMTLVVTAASDIFDQDIEDMPEGMVGDDQPTRPPVAMPQEKKAGTQGTQEPSAEEVSKVFEGEVEHPKKTGKVISEAQGKRLYAMAKGAGHDDTSLKALIAKHGYSHTKDIVWQDYEAICKEAEQGPIPF